MTRASFELAGLDGANPLGFLAALGTLVTLQRGGVRGSRLRWVRRHAWIPVLEGTTASDARDLAEAIADGLRGESVDPDADQRRAAAQKAMEAAKKAIQRKREEIKKRMLSRSERAEVEERELRPLKEDFEAKRRSWLEALRHAVPRPELALGKRLDCTSDEYREHAAGFLTDAGYDRREALDLLAAFGSDAVRRRSNDTIEPTPFCFISGSGHQDFLDTARQLMG